MSEVDRVISPRVRAVENMVARAREKTSSVSGGPACINCTVTAWISFFFDGTNNHRERDFPVCHSNVAGLFDAHADDPSEGIVRLYYEGVGTRFEFEDRHVRVPVPNRMGTVRWEEREGYRERESRVRQGFGGGIDIRLEKAIFDFENTVEDFRATSRVDEINIGVFGFSRGAAQARAFVNWLAEHSKISRQGESLAYDGIPLNVKFVGLFDTVESVGGAGVNRRPGLVKTSMPFFVQRCVHIVAAHELRNAFPLTGLGTNRYTQVVYPGAHADIGGGYEDSQQGRSDRLARIAALQMLDHARGAGLKMRSLAEMQGSGLWAEQYAPGFDVPPEAHQALSAYLGNVRKRSGLLREVFEAHMELYWAWIDSGLAIEDAHMKREALPRPSRNRQAPGSRQFLTMAHLLRHQARTAEGRGAFGSSPDRGVVPEEVEEFFETYVHDSFEHFSMTGGTMQTDLSTADYYEVRTILAPRA